MCVFVHACACVGAGGSAHGYRGMHIPEHAGGGQTLGVNLYHGFQGSNSVH